MPKTALAIALMMFLLASGHIHAAEQRDQAPSETRLNASNWPIFRGNTLADGVARCALAERPKLIWRFEVSEGAFEGTPAIVDEVVYIGDLDGTLYALSLKDGREIWKYKIDGGFPSSPAVRESRVYLGDYDGGLHCVDTKTGAKLWVFETNAEINSCANFYKDKVLVGSQDATLYCLKADSGELAWKHMIQDQIRCSPTIVDGRAFLAGCDGQLHIVDLERGVGITSVPINAPTGVTPAVRGMFAYFGTEAGEMLSVNWQEAKVVWTFADTRRAQPIRSSPAVNDSVVVFGGRGKRVYALDPKTGEELWAFPTKQRVDSSPVIVGDRAFVGSGDGRLYALRLSDGKKDWEYETGGGFTGSPAVADNRLVIANDNGVVYCFGGGAN